MVKKDDKPPPLWEKVGAVRLPIYPLADGRYCIVYRPTAKAARRRITRVDLDEARKEARRLCIAIANGQTAADHLSAESRLRAAAAIGALSPLGMTVDGAARDLVQAHRITGGATIMEMARWWAQSKQAVCSRSSAADIHADLLASHQDHELNAVYARQLREDLGRFARAFGKRPIGEITSSEILSYLRGLGVGWRRRNNVHALIVTLFLHAKTTKHLPQDRDTEPELIKKLPAPKDAPPPQIFSPSTLEKILRFMEAKGNDPQINEHLQWIPMVVLGAFAGLRIKETEAIVWQDIFWGDKVIHIRQEVAKQTTRKHGDVRFVPMTDNLLAWLRDWEGAKGSVCPEGKRFDNYRRQLLGLLPNRRWGKNPLRHSWFSYLEGQMSNLEVVSKQGGNSPSVAKAVYINPRMEREAVAWFGIYPSAKRGKIIIPLGAR